MAEANSTVTYRPIPDFPGYRIGDDGSVWSCRILRQAKLLGQTWRQLRPKLIRNTGYLCTWFWNQNRITYRQTHRLVLEVFVGPCPPGMQCCHNDGNKTNNVLSNLRWDTPQANADDKIRHGHTLRGERNPRAKLTEAEVRAIRADWAANKASQRRLAIKHHVHRAVIRDIIRRKIWKHLD